MSAADGFLARRRWFGTAFVPWDEVDQREGGFVRLRSGDRVRLPDAARADADVALDPPTPSGRVGDDAADWARYVHGAWSPTRAARSLLAIASRAGASDVHLEPSADRVVVRLRMVGELLPLATLEEARGARLVAALKHLSGCLPYRSDVVQEGTLPREGVAADVRASFMPTAYGERTALRLFGRLLTLPELGLGDAEAPFRAALALPHGLVLVAGPSGAGKTTTLYAALAHLAASRGGAHLSLEDPVEQRLRAAGIAVDQVELRPERGLDGAVALAGALRQDVDVIAVGEVRTPLEAGLALQAAHTGRLVLAGLHAGSVDEARQRMLDLGADPAILAATLRGVLHQRLETVTCSACAGDCPCGGVGRRRVLRATMGAYA